MLTLTEIAQAICERQKTAPIAGMTIREFAGSGRTLRIRSSILDEVVAFAADNADISGLLPDTVVYSASELFELCRPGDAVDSELLRLIHSTKKVFIDARIISDNS